MRRIGIPINGRGALHSGQRRRPSSGTERFRHIFLASWLLISEWRGTASIAPVLGLAHKEWDLPSRLR